MGFVGNLVFFPAVKDIWKYNNNWQRCRYEFSVLLFGTVYSTELDIGRVHPWVGSGRVGLGHKILRLGWVGLGRAQCQNI